MFKIIKPALVAGLAIAAISAPASAQVNGMATSNIGLTVANSQALQTGFQQINTTYQSQITQVEQLNQQRMQLVQQLDTNNDGNLDEAEQAVLNESNPPCSRSASWNRRSANCSGRHSWRAFMSSTRSARTTRLLSTR